MIEFHDSDFDAVDEFSLLWRWSNESHAVFLSEELDNIRPFKSEVAHKLHDKLLTVHHQNGLNCAITKDLREIQYNDDNENTIQNWLIKLPMMKSEQIIISWTSDTAILTTWELFTKRWSDFWYPSSDDLTVTPVSMSWVLGISHGGFIQWAEWSNKQHARTEK